MTSTKQQSAATKIKPRYDLRSDKNGLFVYDSKDECALTLRDVVTLLNGLSK